MFKLKDPDNIILIIIICILVAVGSTFLQGQNLLMCVILFLFLVV